MALGDPDGEVAFAYSLKEAVARFYETRDTDQAADLLRDIIDYGSKSSAPFEVRRLARTLSQLVRPDRRLAPGKGLQRADRRHEQPHQTRQTRRFRLYELRELPHPGAALCRQAQLQSPRFDRRQMTSTTWLTPLIPEEPLVHDLSVRVITEDGELVRELTWIPLGTTRRSLDDVNYVPGQVRPSAADLGNSPLSITEIPQLIAGVGCR